MQLLQNKDDKFIKIEAKLIKKEMREQWTLNCLRKYYHNMYQKYHAATLGEEVRTPNILSIEDVVNGIKNHGLFFS